MNERDDDAFVGEILAKAGKRPDVPVEPIAEIIDTTRALWRRRVRVRRLRLAVAWTLPIAATLVIGFVLLRPRNEPKSVPASFVATMVRARGLSVAPGTRITAGSWIDVPPGGTATLRIGKGSSLRLRGGTRAQLVSAAATRLDYGAAYLDCPPTAADVSVLTAAGDFTPAGTQFEVRAVRGGETELRVREGVVTLKGRVTASAHAGEVFVVSPGGGLRHGTLLPYDASWQWAEGMAPMIEIEGTSLHAFLEWMAHEKGRALTFADARAAALSATIVLHGSIANMTLDEALQTIAAGSGFTYRFENGVLRIEGL
jgi:ferric-dicitrate binding protein FerR (iron transport regulator)